MNVAVSVLELAKQILDAHARVLDELGLRLRIVDPMTTRSARESPRASQRMSAWTVAPLLAVTIAVSGCRRETLAPPPQTPPIVGETLYVDHQPATVLDVSVADSPAGSLWLVIEGVKPTPCHVIPTPEAIVDTDAQRIDVTVQSWRGHIPGFSCFTEFQPYRRDLFLRALRPGTYDVAVRGTKSNGQADSSAIHLTAVVK